MKIVVFILTAVIQLAAAAFGLLLLLLALNGYSESQATPSLIFYVALGIGSALFFGLASASVASRLVVRKSLSKPGASAISVAGFAVLGCVVLVVGSIVAVVLAEVVRGMR